jgi:threonine dehydrogenase-like Zn-dependent dehydrogenase
MTDLAFSALEYGADTSLNPVRLRFAGSTDQGFEIERNGESWLRVGPGYRALRTRACGVCSTDLDRHFLPFRLPQVTGHELLALDDAGRRVVVEINAGPRERGLGRDCPDCAVGLSRHCPERLVLGIHDLPGGFGPYVLAPVGAVVPVPDEVDDDVALLVEPFAAALRAVDRTELRDGDRVAVLGPRKLGMLILAALAARRRERAADWTIVARVRRPELVRTAEALGADEVRVEVAPRDIGVDDVVFDTTASPEGFEVALRLARRELHLKSTHGRPAGGLAQATAFVVDELSLESFAARRPGSVEPGLWLAAGAAPGAEFRAPDDFASGPQHGGCLSGAHTVVVDDLSGADRAIRPERGRETGLVRPTGTILLREPRGGALADAVVGRGLRLGASRCGDFRTALGLLAADPELRAAVRTLITGRFPATELGAALAAARQRDALKVVVDHGVV